MKDEHNDTQSPENANKEKFMGWVMEAVQQALRRGEQVDDPRTNPIVQGLVDGIGPSPVAELPRAQGGAVGGRFGRLVVDSNEFKQYAATGAKGVSSRIDFAGLGAVRQAAGIASLPNINDVLGTMRLQGVTMLPMRPLHVIDLFNAVPTTQNSVTFIQQTGYTNNSAAIARHNSDPSTATAAPQNVITVASVNRPIADIEAHIPIPRVLFEDVPAMQAVIESQLIEGLYDALDVEILRGSGVSPHMTGIVTESNIQTYSWSAGEVGDNRADAIGRSIAQAAVAKYAVSGIVMHPTNAWQIRLLKNDDKDYLFPQGLQQNGQAPISLWGLPVAETAQMTLNRALVGAFQVGADYYDRQQGQVQFLDQHSDWATKGLYCALATLRGAIVVYRPESFVHITLDSAPASS